MDGDNILDDWDELDDVHDDDALGPDDDDDDDEELAEEEESLHQARLELMQERELQIKKLAQEAGIDDVKAWWEERKKQRGQSAGGTEPERMGIEGHVVHLPAIAGQAEPCELLKVPDIRQPDDYGCGACAAMAVGKYFAVGPDDLKDWYAALGTNIKTATNPKVIANYLRACGLDVEERYGMSIEDLYDCWCCGRPVICQIQEYGLPSKMASFDYGHVVVVIGVALGKVMVQDPAFDNVLEGEDADQAPGKMMIDQAKFMEVWWDKDAEGNEYKQYGIICGPPVK